jgi:hypothetical protein
VLISKVLSRHIRRISSYCFGRLNIGRLKSYHLHGIFSIETSEYSIIDINYTNCVSPLIRYKAGNKIEYYDNDACDCGKPDHMVLYLDSCKENYVVGKSGRCLSRLDHIFKSFKNKTAESIRSGFRLAMC